MSSKTVDMRPLSKSDLPGLVAAGIDAGSAFSKAVVLTGDGGIYHQVVASRGDFRGAANKAMEEALRRAGLEQRDITSTVVTGVGAESVAFSEHQVPEISCQGKGIHHTSPSVRTIIDIGDQATRVVKVDDEGRPTYFVISERCAAGSGRFLQIMARVLQVDLQEIGELSLRSNNPVTFSTNCAVFAESEAISRISEGASKEDLLAGIHNALAAKIVSMVERVGLENDCVVTGGGAMDIGLVKRLEDTIGVDLLVPAEPQITAALGAAIITRERGLPRQAD